MADYKNNDGDLYALLEQMGQYIARDPQTTANPAVTNKPFAFNPNSVRVGSTTNQYAPLQDMNTRSIKLTRGFIRNLITDLGGANPKFKNMRCNFQFNPQDIIHAIEARKDMYLPILQDPAQLKQPMAGNASFEFDLVFDRTMEVNSSTSSFTSETVRILGSDQAISQRIPDTSSAATVGVFHDLRILYSIIGQGISAELLDAQEAKLRQDIKAYAAKNYSELNLQATVDSNGNITGYETTYVDVNTAQQDGVARVPNPQSTATAAFLNSLSNDPSSNPIPFMSNINIGNSAFLIPQPVRVIFSPMFMVDGFVMNTKVLFTKFSANMIPIQCKVSLQMQAVYLGFARARTFLSEQLKETEVAGDAEFDKANTEIAQMTTYLKTHLSKISVAYSSDNFVIDDKEATTGYVSLNNAPNGKEISASYQFQPIWLYGTKHFWYSRPESGAVEGYEPLPQPYYNLNFANPISSPAMRPGVSLRLGYGNGDFLKKNVYEALSASNPKIKLYVYSKIFGPFNTESAGTSFVTQTLGTVGGKNPSPDALELSGTALLGSYSYALSLSSAGTWETYSNESFCVSSDASKTIDANNSSNKAPNPITPGTKNSSNVSVISYFDSQVNANVTGYPPAVTAAIKSAYHISSEEEDSSGTWNVGPEYAEAYPVFPQGLESVLKDSLLQYVNTVHGLDSKYFVVCTDTYLEWSINDGAGANTYRNARTKTTRLNSVVRGDTVGLVQDISFQFAS